MAAPPVLVLDASVPLGWALPDEGRSAPARAALASLGAGTALVPPHWRTEIGNGLLLALRRGRLAPDNLPWILARLSTLPVAVDDAGARDAWEHPMARALSTGLTLYDTLYLDLAQRHHLPLATLDAALRRTALATDTAVLP